MLAKDIKEQMTLDDVYIILESLGCEKIRQCGNYISSTKGDGSDNPNGIVIWNNHQDFVAQMYTTPEFDDFGLYKDIFCVVQFLKGISFSEAVNYIVEELSMKEQEKTICDILSWLDNVECKTRFSDYKNENIVYNKKTLDQFVNVLHPMWESEGITRETSERFHIGFDYITECITIPVFDESGNLVGCKMRETKKNDYGKYCYALKTRKSLVLYGLFENKDEIKKAGEVIVFEAEKSVLKAHSMGIRNCVAIGGKIISESQSELLSRLSVNIVLALDEDVGDDDILLNVNTLNGFFIEKKIFVLKDNRLKSKESPADNVEVMTSYKQNMKEVCENGI